MSLVIMSTAATTFFLAGQKTYLRPRGAIGDRLECIMRVELRKTRPLSRHLKHVGAILDSPQQRCKLIRVPKSLRRILPHPA